MKKLSFQILFLLLSFSGFSQVQRAIDGQSVMRDQILANTKFDFFRDWSSSCVFKSGIGETVTFFPITLTIPDKKIVVQGVQVDAMVKPQHSGMVTVENPSGNKNFLTRSIFIDKDELSKFIDYLEKDVVPNLNNTYKKQSKEWVFKTKEMFFSFLIYEKTARITMHVADFGPYGDGNWGGDQIEFWTETKVDELPTLVNNLKSYLKAMK